ncbi:MAG: DUF3047 domain-containing protein [Methylococcales symbiont of Iophon sp. n. MRB-2018]|nr:MAG: DUF3047 domain-containing protein [Methylococcales symbiont of Iophon sp. n. MRB-2018]KAF3979676.1 MAG: DUF3047 domain-containing protein [Methylococcales symbiont of Iophon sp. n. MRB-2018]
MKLSFFKTLLVLSVFLSSAFAETKTHIVIDSFSSGNLNQWETKSFVGTTNYQVVSVDNQLILRAVSHASASALIKKQKIDLLKTPFLNWRWRVENLLGKINEQSKSGDDYSARVYVLIDGGWAFWNSKAINYVWASNSEKGKQWPNAFASNNATMLALRSANDKTAKWYQEKRNIIEDFKTLYGIDIRYIDAVALMTDTDNSEGQATAYYGDIYFSEN